MFGNTVLVLFYLAAPAFVLWLCGRFRWMAKLGPILILYILGIIVGNVGVVPGISLPDASATIQDVLTSVAIPVAVPLMLLGCTFRRSETRSQLLALLTGVVSVIIAVACGYILFADAIDASSSDKAAEIAGMLTGVYTGGTINLAALKTVLDVSDETYMLINGYDIVVSFIYIMFLVTVGVKSFRKFLPNETAHDETVFQEKAENPYKGLFSGRGAVSLLKLILVVAVICALSYGTTLLLPAVPFMTVFMLALTTFSIAASFVPKIRTLPYAYDVGMYCIYVFSIVVASMADFSKLDFRSGSAILGYLSLVIFGSLLLQLIFAKVMKIDSDTTVISSVAFICSPPFVPMIAAAMKNRRVIIAGLSIGIIGYAIGNYLGYAVSRVLPLLFH